MKNTIKLSRLILFILLYVIVFSSCKKDEAQPDYAGTWVVTGAYTLGNMTFEMKDILTLSKGSFSDVIQIKDPTNNKWINASGIKGSVSANENLLTFIIQEIGVSSVNVVTQMPTGTLEYYKDGQTEFDDLLSANDLVKTYNSEYSIADNTLTLKTDINEDQDYNDAGETILYTRQ